MLARLLGTWNLRFRNWHLYLRPSLDRTRLLSRYFSSYFSSQRNLIFFKCCFVSSSFCSFRLQFELNSERYSDFSKELFLWLKIGFKHFLETELKDLHHKYSIFYLIHLSKSKLFFLHLLLLLRSFSISESWLLISSSWILRFDISHSSWKI